MINAMRPIHPGEILHEEMEVLGLSARALAKYLDTPPNRISGILKGVRGLSADTALRLARYFGTTPEFWMNLQSAYDLRLAQQHKGEAISAQVRPRAA